MPLQQTDPAVCQGRGKVQVDVLLETGPYLARTTAKRISIKRGTSQLGVSGLFLAGCSIPAARVLVPFVRMWGRRLPVCVRACAHVEVGGGGGGGGGGAYGAEVPCPACAQVNPTHPASTLRPVVPSLAGAGTSGAIRAKSVHAVPMCGASGCWGAAQVGSCRTGGTQSRISDSAPPLILYRFWFYTTPLGVLRPCGFDPTLILSDLGQTEKTKISWKKSVN